MTESLLLVPFVLPDKLFHNQGSHSKSWAHLGQSAPCGRGQAQLLCYYEAMTALFNNFAFVFLCRAVKTSRHSSKQTKTENAKCCTLKTIWAKRLFALKTIWAKRLPSNLGNSLLTQAMGDEGWGAGTGACWESGKDQGSLGDELFASWVLQGVASLLPHFMQGKVGCWVRM